MAKDIPTFRVDIAEGMIPVDASATSRLFAYCIEADKGPINTPTLITSNKEAIRTFGIDFEPHFYQNPEGVVIIRVGFEEMTKGKIEYKNNNKTLLKIESTHEGKCEDKVKVVKNLSEDGYNVSVTIKDIISKKYQGIPTLTQVANKINKVFGKFLVAETTEDYRSITSEPVDLTCSDSEGRLLGGSNGKMLDGSGNIAKVSGATKELDDATYGLNGTDTTWKDDNTKPNPNVTLHKAYKKAFEVSSYVDVVGVATLSDKQIVRNTLFDHITYMSDPEVHSYRFGIVGLVKEDMAGEEPTVTELKHVSETFNSEWIVFIGQSVKFIGDDKEERILKSYEAVQLFTGIRSALGYAEAIFGGEQKKVLKGVTDVIPVVGDESVASKRETIVDLNESGVCTFKKEYDEITFLEGVTTVQQDERDADVMTYENLMSIICFVSKRLVAIAKPYQGQRLTEDLKSTLQTALSTELKNITETDGTLMAIEEYNIPPYDVQVYSAAKTKFDETNRHLIRESKIIIQCRIVPVGALRDIDMHIIAI